MTLNTNNLFTGAIFVAIGAFAALWAVMDMQVGSALRMGPGYFPVIIGVGLVFFGIVVALQGGEHTDFAMKGLPWRGIILISLAPILFGATVRGFGLVPATILATVSAAYASKGMTLFFAVVLALCLATFCTLVFVYGLGLSLPVVGLWLWG
ncbi:tripartite tricarboxylate transporter TctB family protein [Propylenella binzhouense]|nr:tripartite tricarboxylate transporter TctB family protein [Propylenella binzhouense]